MTDFAPAGIELRILPQGGDGSPEFVWMTLPFSSIVAVLPMRSGEGCTISLAMGENLLCSNRYDDVSGSITRPRFLGFRLDIVEDLEPKVIEMVTVVDEEPEIGDEAPADVLDFFANGDDYDDDDDDDDDEDEDGGEA